MRRALVAALIGFGPLAITAGYFFLSATPGDVNLGAAFYLGAALVITPILIFAGAAYYFLSKGPPD